MCARRMTSISFITSICDHARETRHYAQYVHDAGIEGKQSKRTRIKTGLGSGGAKMILNFEK